MFVGEAPGAEEDRQGLPFVGRAGQLLNQLLEEIGLSREEVFIANVLKSRPPGNRDPQPLEIEACKPYLFEQVRLIEPKVVCTLGNFATKLLSGSPVGITKVRGTPQVHELGGRTVFLLPLLHPAAALRTPAMKETAARRPRDGSRPARRHAAGAGAERRGDRRRRSARPPASRRPRRRRRDQLGHVRLSVAAERDRDASSAAETEALGRPRRRAPAARRRGRRQRRGRGRQDDADPRRLPGARRSRSRSPRRPSRSASATAAAACRSPTSTSTGWRASRARTRPCSTTTSAPTASPSSSGRRSGSSGSAGRRWRSGSSTPAASSRRARDRLVAQARSRTSRAGRVRETANTTCSIGSETRSTKGRTQ